MATGFNITQSDGRVVDLDDVLVRRENLDAGQAFTWGNPDVGRLGNASISTSRSSPATISGNGYDWKLVSAGDQHSIGLKTDGTAWTWGGGANGKLGNSSTLDRSSPVTLTGGGIWRTVWAGHSVTGGIKTDGTLWCWGLGGYGQIGNSSILDRNSPVQPTGGGTNWAQGAMGTFHSAAIKTDGTLWTWGYNDYGQLGQNTLTTASTSSPAQVAGGGTTWRKVGCGWQWTAAIKTDNSIWTWGRNWGGFHGNGTTTDRSSPGTMVINWTDWRDLYVGAEGCAAIKTDGTLWTWGRGDTIGDGTVNGKSSPVTTAGGGTNWRSVSTSAVALHVGAVKTDGTLWMWGAATGTQGLIGDGFISSRSSPTLTAGGGTKWATVAVGREHTVALTDIEST